MLSKSEMKDRQWYYGQGHNTNVGQWQSTEEMFLFGKPSSVKNSPPEYKWELHVQDEHDGCIAKCFTPMIEVSGPEGPWTPQQCIDLGNNLDVLHDKEPLYPRPTQTIRDLL